jgi:hypothetical protein
MTAHEAGDPIQAAMVAALEREGVIVVDRAGEEAWHNGTDILPPAVPTFTYDGAAHYAELQGKLDTLAALAVHEAARKAWRGSVIVNNREARHAEQG